MRLLRGVKSTVRHQTPSQIEYPVAVVAMVSAMRDTVPAQFGLRREPGVATRAAERPLTVLRPHVRPECVPAVKLLAADIAPVRLLTGVYHHVVAHVLSLREGLRAKLARVLARVAGHMLCQGRAGRKVLLTVVAGETVLFCWNATRKAKQLNYKRYNLSKVIIISY